MYSRQRTQECEARGKIIIRQTKGERDRERAKRRVGTGWQGTRAQKEVLSHSTHTTGDGWPKKCAGGAKTGQFPESESNTAIDEKQASTSARVSECGVCVQPCTETIHSMDVTSIPKKGKEQEPGFVGVTPASGSMTCPPVSVCQNVSTMWHLFLPTCDPYASRRTKGADKKNSDVTHVRMMRHKVKRFLDNISTSTKVFDKIRYNY